MRFSLSSNYPVPYQRCYCSICRKTAGGGGYCINISGDAASLVVDGKEHVRIYQAMLERDGQRRQSTHERHFCSMCGSHLWAFNSRWPELIHPVATAIDTPLPAPTESVHMMVGSKASWVSVEGRPGEAHFEKYPEESIARFHEDRGLRVE